MGVLQFFRRPVRRGRIGGIVQLVVRIGRHDRQMRLEVGEVQEPGRIPGGVHEGHGPVRHERRIAVFPPEPRGIGGMVPVGVRGHIHPERIVYDGGVVSSASEMGQPAFAPGFVQFPGFQAGQGRPADPLFRLRRRIAGRIGGVVRLAAEGRPVARFAKIVAHGLFVRGQGHLVPGRTVGVGIPARVEAHAAGTADRRLHVGPAEEDAPGREFVEVGRSDHRVAGAGHAVRPHLVGHDEKYVQSACGHVGPRRTSGVRVRGTSNGRFARLAGSVPPVL